jgi:SAM-dependent methyltransferase
LALRPELRARGFEIQPRDGTAIPVETFDGRELPLAAKSVDYILFIDVLHHTEAPQQLLREGIRVARRGILVKDHLLQGFLARATLRLMDGVGNARHGVALPYNYWAPAKWREVFEKTDLHGAWNTELRLYPIPLDWLFGRSLHFLVRLESNITPRLGAFRPEPVAVE